MYPKSRSKDVPCHAIQALFWVAFAKSPMTDRELKQGLAVDEGDSDYLKSKDIVKGFNTLCGELIIVDPLVTYVLNNWGEGPQEILKPNTTLSKATERFLTGPFD